MYRFEELARAMLGLDDETGDGEEELFNKYGIDIEQFDELIVDILPFCYPLQTPLTDTWTHTLGVVSDDGRAWTALASAKVTYLGTVDADELKERGDADTRGLNNSRAET